MTFFHTHISKLAIKLATETLQSGFVSEGEKVRHFEAELARILGLIRPVAVNSGTSALHLSLVLSDVKPGDEVILPAQAFIACGLVILMCGAQPVFADIQPNTGNLDPQSIGAKITPRTKAIMAVHWGGCPCDMDEIHVIAAAHGLAVVEDAAHALGASYKGNPVGSLSRFTAFSFQAIKHLTTGDGGALCCLENRDFEEALRLRWFGIDRVRDHPSILGERVYDASKIGFKYHLNDIAASVGLGNLPDIAAHLNRHREIASHYCTRLNKVPGLNHLTPPADRESSYWIYTVLVQRREDFIRALRSRGVPTSVVHRRIDRNRVFGGLRSDLPNQRQFDELQVSLPVHVGMTDDDVAQTISAVLAGW